MSERVKLAGGVPRAHARHGCERESRYRRLAVGFIDGILLADDHPMISTAIEALLRNSPFEIVGMASTWRTGGSEGRGTQARHPAPRPPDAGRHGMDVLRKLRSDGGRTRIVLLTAAIDDGSLIEAKTQGAGHGAQEFDPAYLLSALSA